MSNMTSNGGKLAGKRKYSDNDEETEDDASVYVKFSIRGQDGKEIFFRLNQNRYLKPALQSYCQKVNMDYETMNFILEGKPIRKERDTPKTLKMVNDDQIDAVKQQTGGGGAAGGN
ncbi:unnamed protein product [Trifolium pratense]|uniref:Uncharacterized protein n=1 Tax=Trifolium pratense TaxID=57577 RepID=A0ACB0M6H3_TRIPR|nr:unnamed protein product [Trifolium pratense]